jgi:signal transduction histidine kinase
MFSETLLLDRVRGDAERRRALEIIGQESQRLGQLVDNVLHFHRQSQPLASLPAVTIDLRRFVREVVESFEPLAAPRRVQLTVATPPEEVLVDADTASLRQVLLNLLDNAVKYGPPGQTIRVALDAAADTATLSVSDQGPGVALIDRDRIFNAFERGRTTHGTGGAGIGLAVVQHIVSAHGGSVSCDGGAEGGARFVVTLPLADAQVDESRLAG